jgi:hypothetical protein
MKIEIGKTYKDRVGDIVTIAGKNPYHDDYMYPYIGNNASTYMEDGRFRQSDKYHDYDLIEEVPAIHMLGSTWIFNNLKEEQTMQAQVTTLKCTLVISNADGELTLQTYPADEGWRESNVVTVLDTEFEVVLSKSKVEELYTKRLADRVQKADEVYKDAIEALETANDFLRNL